MQDVSDIMSTARAKVADGSFEAALAALVAHRTESQEPGQAAALHGYLEQEMIPRLAGLGFGARIHDNPDPRGGPILVARRDEGADLPTVLSYGHGDVVRGQDDAWEAGLEPFELARRGDRLYGRGTADNKAQHLINILALEAVLATRGALGFNMVWVLEMSEEAGSAGLEAFCAAHKEELAADVLVASDGPRLRPNRATIFLGARGALNFELVIDLREGAHHSGNWGGLIADPAIVLAQALATITDARGALQIPEWRPDSLTPDIRAVLARLPDPAGGPEIDRDWGEPGLTPAERAYGWNSFAILALHAGRPEAPVNAIAGSARAACQLRFVVGTDTGAILPALRRHLDAQGFEAVRIEQADPTFFSATRTDPNGAWPARITQAIAAATGQDPDVLPNLAGSLPNHVFSETLGLPTVWIPHSYGGCNQHAPNEHVLLPVCEDALGVMTAVYCALGQPDG